MPLIAGFGMLIHTKSRRTKNKKRPATVYEPWSGRLLITDYTAYLLRWQLWLSWFTFGILHALPLH